MTASPLLLRRLLPLALLLGGCSPGETDRFFEGVAQIIVLAMVFMALMACVGVVLLAVQLLVIVLNFVRPSVASMVTGYVFAGLHVFSMLGSLALMASSLVGPGAEGVGLDGVGLDGVGLDGASAVDMETVVNSAVGFILAVGLGALLAGSSYYAQQRLAAAKGLPA